MNRTITAQGFLAIFLALTSDIDAGEPRTFTSPDGRTIQAEIIGATPDRVSLKTIAGQPLVAPIDRFIVADQEFISQWRKDHPVEIKYKFTADYTKAKTSSSKSVESNTEITTEIWECNMKISNLSGQTLEGVSADYVIYFDQMDGKNKVTKKLTGKADIGSMKNLQQMVIKTDSVKLISSQLQGGYYYNDGSRNRQKDAITAMAININHEGKKVFTWASRNVPAGGTTAEGSKGSLIGQ